DQVSLEVEFRAAADELAASNRLGSCKVEFQAAENLPTARVDRSQLARLADILLRKAVALNKGAGTIKVGVSAGVAVGGAPGQRVTISGSEAGWATASPEALFTPLAPESQNGEPRDLGL